MEQNSDAQTRYAKTKQLKEHVALFNLLQSGSFTSVQQLHEKIASVNSSYYDLRGQIVSTERRLDVLDKHLKMWAHYEQYKPIRIQCDRLAGKKQERFMEEHRAELTLFDAAYRYLSDLKAGGETLAPKKWQTETKTLSAQKDKLYRQMSAMREEIKSLETLHKTVDLMIRDEQRYRKEEQTLE